MRFLRKTITLVLALILSAGAMTITAYADSDLMYGIGFVDATSLRLRSEASASSRVLADAPRNDCVTVIAQEGDWYKVNYNLQVGYMHSDYLKVSTRENAELGYGQINASDVNLRSGPATSYSRVTTGAEGEKCYIIGINNGWYKVIFEGSIAYIRSDYLDLTEYPYENKASGNSPKFFRGGKSTGVSPSGSALNGSASAPSVAEPVIPKASGAEILQKAQSYLGTPYVYGGASPSGFDCSGFVYYVLKQSGYSPSRTLTTLYKQGTYVDKSDLQPGDVVFFANTYTSGLSHVGFYAGGGQFIHAPNSRSAVSYSDLTSGYWANHYYGAQRMG